MLLIHAGRVDERRRAVKGPLAPLFQSLAAELEPALKRDIYIPRDKALLSRAGGRCERDGSNLEFDPFSPTSHQCPLCSTVYTGELHDRAWNTWYHLWLAERAVQASLFHVLTGDARCAMFAAAVLAKYSEVYLTYPNVDNVLGPTRPFFSTYLESIWLQQICIATDLLEHAGQRRIAEVVRDRIVEPSRALIAGFNEGASNRQVWNNAALIASALLLGDKELAATPVRVKSGVIDHLSHALLSDGTWFEGDNYHQFAIRGLWYAVTMCEVNELDLPLEPTRAFDRGVAATFASALPDFTFPSRKDSQYAVSLRQWRFAELAELGFARQPDGQLGGALARCYESGHERRDTGRARSTADAERNTMSSLLTRSDLGWRALVCALPELPALEPSEPKSVHLTGQGLAIFRRPAQVFIALDYGQSGAGHGHPDRLNLLLSQGDTRWLDDLGTGSYVEQSLHWYRSSLAHNAPFVGGQSQRGGDGRLLAYDERGDIGWVEAQFIDGGLKLTRTIVVARNYLVHELAWTLAPGAPPKEKWDFPDLVHKFVAEPFVDLPWHMNAVVDGVQLAPSRVEGGEGLEDGFEFAKDWQMAPMPKGEPVRLNAVAGARSLTVTLLTKAVSTLMRATAPGQPASRTAPFYMIRLHGGQGRLRAVAAWEPNIAAPEFDGEKIRIESPGRRDVHLKTPTGWRVEVTEGRATKTTDLAGRVARPAKSGAQTRTPTRVRITQPEIFGVFWSELSPADRKRMHVVELGENNYRRSEVPWAEAGSPTATLAINGVDQKLEVLVDVRALNQRFSPPSAVNSLDNEHADTMGAGIQLYADTALGRGMWMLVPEAGSGRVRVRPIAGNTFSALPVARWRPTDLGYELQIVLTISRDYDDLRKLNHDALRHLDLTIAISDAVEGRERRRGQLVTGDARGEFVYLRGDREDGSHALHLETPL